MLPQFISLGPLSVNLYTALVGLAAAAALALAGWQLRDARVLNTFLIIGIGAGLAGRLGYLAIYQPPNGEPGLQAHAALLGGWLTHVALQRIDRPALPGLPVFSQIALAGLIGIGASIGCIPNACGYGREVFWANGGDQTLAWALRVDWPDAYSLQNPRLPTQLFAAGGVLVLMSVAAMLLRRSIARPRTVWLGWLTACAVGDFGLQGLRADAMPVWQGWRAEQWLDGGFLMMAILLMLKLLVIRLESHPTLHR